jgi:hypothetical protein
MRFSTSNSFEIKILPVTYCSPEIKQDFAAKLMIPIDRGGGGWEVLNSQHARIEELHPFLQHAVVISA